MLLLDNSVVRKYSRPSPDEAVVSYLKAHAGDVWVTSATVAYEYLSFYEDQSKIRRQRRHLESVFQRIYPVTTDVAAEAARLRVLLADHDASLNRADLLHLAAAAEIGATFVTADANDFDRPEIHDLADVDVIDVS